MAMLSFFALKFELDNWCWILVWGTILWQAETPALLDYEFKILTSSFLLYALCSMLYAFANLQSEIFNLILIKESFYS
jgi:hypothetical protein